MLNFDQLRSQKFKKEMEEQQKNLLNKNSKKMDDRLYFPRLSPTDEENIIDVRFLPFKQAKKGEEHLKFELKHVFDIGNKNIYIPCPKTIGKECPMCKTLVWDDDDEVVKALYRERRARALYYANLYIINDRKYPEENGTVRVIRFGPQLMGAIESSLKEEGLHMFDLWENGATFRIKVKPKGINPTTKKAFPNYEASSFRQPEVFLDGAEEAEKIFEQTHDLNEFVKTDKIKSYEEIEKYISQFGLVENTFLEPPSFEEKRKEPETKKLTTEEATEKIENKKEKIINESIKNDKEESLDVSDFDNMTEEEIENLIDNI